MALAATAEYQIRTTSRQRLIDLVREFSLIQGERVKLASGTESTFYFNMKPTSFHPEGASLIAELVLSEVWRDGAEFIGGLEIGAIPIVGCVSQRSSDAVGRSIPGFIVRKTPKDHGTRELIEGLPREIHLNGRRVLIVDDVTTTGESVLKAVEAARLAGADVRTVVTIVDRLEGATKNLARHCLKLIALTTSRDYGIHP